MHTVLALQHTEGELTIHLDGGLLDPGSFTILIVEHLHACSRSSRPTCGTCAAASGPIVALGTASTTGDLHHGTERILFRAEHVLELQLLQCVRQPS
jgi:hypothetical protein